MNRFEKALQELGREKEDIELLLSSLEDAYAEAAITEKHYNELKTKNKKKLEEIERRIEIIKKRMSKKEKQSSQEGAPRRKEKKKSRKKATQQTATEKKTEQKEEPGQIEEDVARVPEHPAVEEPQQQTVSMPREPAETKVITEQEFRSILSKIFEKTKLVDIAEIQPKLEKLSIETEKIKAFVDAIKDEKNTVNESLSRINEVLGELRSTIHSNEARLSEIEMKVKDMDSLLSVFKPERYSRGIQKIEKALSMHEARLDKLDDLTSVIMKRISDIKGVLQQFGSMEQIARMNNEISKKLISIDDREKRIRRISDKLDGMFAEISKRLDEFIFYKAKQENIEELVNELLRSVDEMNNKLANFADKTDLDMLRDSLESKIAEINDRLSSGLTDEQRKLQSDKEEVEDLLSILEEQHRKGVISDSEYEKAKQENLRRIKEIEEKLTSLNSSSELQSSSTAVQSEQFPISRALSSGVSGTSADTSNTTGTGAGQQGANEAPFGSESANDSNSSFVRAEQPPSAPKPVRKNPNDITPANESALKILEQSFRSGLISKDAYENAKRILEK